MDPNTEELQQEIVEFVDEILNMLDSIEPTLIKLESSQDKEEIHDAINGIFRLFHGMKGGAGFLQLKTIEEITHSAEDLLQHFRKHPEIWRPQNAEVLVHSCDFIRNLLQYTKENFTDLGFEDEAKSLIQTLEQHLNQITSAPIFDLPEPKKEAGKKESSFSTAIVSESPLSEDRLTHFIQTTYEHLDNIEGLVLILEKLVGETEIQEYLQAVFRSFHTIKGNAGFLDLPPIERLSHKIETFLEEIQQENLPLNEQSCRLILEVVDVFREGLQSLSKDPYYDLHVFTQVERKLAPLTTSPDPSLLGNILLEIGAVHPQDLEIALQKQQSPLGNILLEMGKVEPQNLEEALQTQQERKQLSDEEKEKILSQTSPLSSPSSLSLSSFPSRPPSPTSILKPQDIRVNLEKLDQLINLVGELVISEAMISQHPSLENAELESLKDASRQLNRYIRELQEITMSMRMMPLSSLFRKMVRVVRDTSKKREKQADLRLIGEKTEVDKTLSEQLADPLLHIIRNAVDHGLETPQEREQAGKPSTGTIQLEACHMGNEVWITIKDDGKGLNRDKILTKAKEKGIISHDVLLSDSEIWNLIFEPGFSTAETVTDLSGRGVGMDVVKKNIEQLRGSISIQSEEGKGSTFTLQVPLTLTIIDGLLIQVASSFYALPTNTIRETLRPHENQIAQTMDGSEMLRLRQELLPILRLHQLNTIPSPITHLSQGMLLIIDHAEQPFCLFVDAIVGQQQIVVKGLPESMAKVPYLSGCTILGDGQVGLILDIASLVKAVTSRKKYFAEKQTNSAQSPLPQERS